MKQRTQTDFSRYIETHADFPKPGVVFFDFTPLLADPDAFSQAVKNIVSHFSPELPTVVAAVEAKGFVLGTAVACEGKLPIVLVRKPELVPGKVDSEKFEKEYGFGEYQLKSGQLSDSDRVLIVYDIMAGAGATEAAIKLVERTGASVVGCAYVIELEYLDGRRKLAGRNLHSLVKVATKPVSACGQKIG